MRSRSAASHAFAIALLVHAPAFAAAQAPDRVLLARQGLVQASGYDPGKPPIVIVHGDATRGNPEIFDSLIEDLSRDFNVFIYTYQRNMIRPRDPIDVKQAVDGFIEGLTDVEDASQEFDDAMRELVRQTGARTVTIMGYSLGGLVARDAFTTDRGSGNTLASDRDDAVKYNLLLVASPQQGIQSLNLVDVPIVGAIVRGVSAAATRLHPFWGPLGDGNHPFMRGAIGRNVTLCQVITDESESDEYVVTEAGQTAVDPAAETPPGNVHRIEAGHVEIITEHSAYLAERLREKAGVPRRGRYRTVSAFDDSAAGGAFHLASAPDMRVSFAQDVATTLINGQVTDLRTTTRETPALNDAFVYEWDVLTVAADGRIGVATMGDGRVRVLAEGFLGRAEASLVVRDSEPDAGSTTEATTFATGGLAWRLGVRGIWSASPRDRRGWFAEAAYAYERVGDLDVVRDPPFAAPPNVVLSETDRVGFRAHVVEGAVGYSTGRFAASGGVRQAARRTELTGAVTATSTQFDASQVLLFVNRFTEHTMQVVGRASVGVGSTPLRLHVDASHGGGWSAVAIAATMTVASR